MSKIAVSVITETARDALVTEIQWGSEEPVNGRIMGYVLIDADGVLTVPFRNSDDFPFVFVLGPEGAAIVEGEDQMDLDLEGAVWRA